MPKRIPYVEQLKDPRWQRKRLEVFDRAGFVCQSCGSDKNTLNVHHRYYQKGFMAWDYPIDSLISVCADCHELIAECERAFLLSINARESHLLPELACLINKLRDRDLGLTFCIDSIKCHMSEFEMEK